MPRRHYYYNHFCCCCCLISRKMPSIGILFRFWLDFFCTRWGNLSQTSQIREGFRDMLGTNEPTNNYRAKWWNDRLEDWNEKPKTLEHCKWLSRYVFSTAENKPNLCVGSFWLAISDFQLPQQIVHVIFGPLPSISNVCMCVRLQHIYSLNIDYRDCVVWDRNIGS